MLDQFEPKNNYCDLNPFKNSLLDEDKDNEVDEPPQKLSNWWIKFWS